MMTLSPIINYLSENDMYKFSMGQAILHQFWGRVTTWEFKCRNDPKKVQFTEAMVEEIREQVKHYCTLRFTPGELNFLSKIVWIQPGFIFQLCNWQPRYEEITITNEGPHGLSITLHGPWFNTSMYETPILSIVNEVYYRMAYNYNDLIASFEDRLEKKFQNVLNNKWYAGNFSDFGFRRRLSAEAQEMAISKFMKLKERPGCITKFVGTSNVYLAYKNGLTPMGTKAHEWYMCSGQGTPSHNPAYSNWYALNAWVKEYGVLNGIALTDTIGTDVFLQDFQYTFASMFRGVRHDSGDPIAWGKKMINHYGNLNIDPKTKTLLFSDSLDFERANEIFWEFRGQADLAYGIGTFLTNDTEADERLNIVLKPVMCDGHHVAKLSDAPGKGMCRSQEYIDYLQNCIDWRMKNAS